MREETADGKALDGKALDEDREHDRALRSREQARRRAPAINVDNITANTGTVIS